MVCIDDEIPFEIPESWQWERWGNLSYSIQYGYNAPAEETGDIRMVRISDIQHGDVLWSTVPFCHINESEIDTYLLQKDDILFARTGGTVGKSFLVKDVPYPSIYAGYLIRTRYSNMLSAQYMKYFMECELYWEQLRNGTIATAQPNCNGKTLAKMILPIPPYNEQIRITDKLNQVLEPARKYGESQDRLDKLNIQIHDLLKKSILREAIQGRLVAQDALDEPASILLQRIKEEKLRLVKEGKLKKKDVVDSVIHKGDDNRYYEQVGKKISDISEEIQFEIPSSWEWCRISTLISLLSGRDLDPTQYNSSHKGLPYITGASNIENETLLINRWTETPVTISHKGDLLLTCKGTIGKLAYNSIGEIHIARQIMAISSVFIYMPYLRLFICSQISEFQKKAQSMIPGIAREAVLNAIIPVPPFHEQIRIANKVEELYVYL